MRRIVTALSLGLIALVLAGALLAFTPLGTPPLSALFPVGDLEPVDFAALHPPANPNWYLVCPEGLCEAPHETAPEFPWPVAELKRRFDVMLATEPRIETLRASDDGLQLDLVQRSARLRFPDLVTVRFMPLDGDRSTLALYSRAIYGRRDFDVNRARVEAWLAALGGGGRGTS